MKSRIYDQFGGGLLVLIMLTIAVVASEAQPKFQETEPAVNVFELDTDLHSVGDQEQLEGSAAPLAENHDSNTDAAR